MKKTVTLLFALLLISIGLTVTIYADEAIINTNHLNVRTEPGTEYDKVTQVHKDEVYPILDIKGEWIKIQLENGSGWISTEFATVKADKNESPDDNIVSDSNQSTITITADNTQLRDGPSTENNIIFFADMGTTFEVSGESDHWYEVIHEDDKAYIYKDLINNTPEISGNKLRNKTFIVDAGHGGHDVGAISINGEYEKDITDKTAKELEKELTSLGAEVILTRDIDQYVYLSGRASIANLYQADAFISIHYNSFPDSESVTGINSYYYADHDEKLAKDIQEELINSSQAKDRDIAFGNYQVLRQNYVPAVLLELGFISNEESEQLLLTNTYQSKLVNGIINGLIKNMR